VAVKLSSWPVAQRPDLLGDTLLAVDQLGDHLAARG
jgi:hypothetical protein